MTLKPSGREDAAEPFAGRDHIVVGIGHDHLGPYWSDLGQGITPVTRDAAIRSLDWYREQHPDWDVRIFRIEEVERI